MPSFYVPARDSRHRAACFALYRALLRQVPRISVPADLTSRSDWIHPITYLIRSGFWRNRVDTSPRLVTSALQSGYRFLTILTRAQDASSASHAEVVKFLRDRQKAFPPPRPPPAAAPPKPCPTPLLTKVSEPGERPVYKSTVRPLPLSKISGGTRKVPVFVDAQGIPFLRIGKPESHSHANFLKRKAMRRQERITHFQELYEDRVQEASEEDQWEATLLKLAKRESVTIADVVGKGGTGQKMKSGNQLRLQQTESGTYEWNMREFGVNYLAMKLRDEMVDMQARATAMLDLVDEERRLAELEKREKKERRRAAREDKVRERKGEGCTDQGPTDNHPTGKHEVPSSGNVSKDEWAGHFVTQGRR
ncbi:E2 ubiquitin-conjugating protein mms2 [Gnomoniopsis sp. IMI 355080]|nr:E2 ubiquitin-conjugating protein mms2 [Gnomoniopsis sp. IMI 355080]